QRDELVAGPDHDSHRQHDRARAHSPQLASRDEVRHPISCFRARQLRHLRLEPAGTHAGHRRVRLVRDSGLAGWRSAEYFVRLDDPEMDDIGWLDRRTSGDGVDLISALLGAEYSDHLSRNGSGAPFRKLGRSLCPDHDGVASGVGSVAGARTRISIDLEWQVPFVVAVQRRLRSIAYGNGRLLGHAVTEHARLHAIRPKSAGAG